MSTIDQRNHTTKPHGHLLIAPKQPMPDVAADGATQGVQTSRLLALPAELRNKVYVFALTADNKLISHCDGLNPVLITKKQEKPAKVFNQLKLVCKQLWAETRYMELQYNTVDFSGAKLESKMPVRFLEKLSLHQRPWLSSIRIREDMQELIYPQRRYFSDGSENPTASKWSLFFDFCELKPHIKVQIVLSDWTHCPPAFPLNYMAYWVTGIQIAALSGREDILQAIAIKPNFSSSVIRISKHARHAREVHGLSARFGHTKNITFLPGISDEEKKETITTNGTVLLGTLGRFYEVTHFNRADWMDTWIPLGMSWASDGIQLG